ncbi:MAG: hypothetical protein AAF488_02100, partial [Planctomycetota bacterium]
MFRFAMLSLVGLISLGMTMKVHADRIYVDREVPTTGNGTSWANAISELRIALDRAEAGDEIWIREGRYVVPVTEAYFRVPSGVQIFGGFEGNESDLAERRPAEHPTILDGDRLGDDGLGDFSDNAQHVLWLENCDAATRVDGVVVHGGVTRPELRRSHGGGAVVIDGSPTFHRVVFRSNRTGAGTIGSPNAGSGGALSIAGSGEVTVSHCEFMSNRAGAGYAPPGVS